MSITSKLTKLLTNKYFLYFVVVLSAINVFGYLVMNKLNAVIFFALVGLVMSFFSKNMIVILIVCMIATNLITSNNIIQEGLTNQNKESGTSTQKKPATTSSTSDESAPIVPMQDTDTTTSDVPEPTVNAMSSMNKKTQKNGSTGRIDYASTLEEAYDNLDKILGAGGINKLTGDTENLMTKQKELFESMKMMTPMVEQAQKMLQGFDLKSLEGLAGLASSFTPAAK